MEVASGEYGEMVNKLVVAVQNGKTNNWNQIQETKCTSSESELTNSIDVNEEKGKRRFSIPRLNYIRFINLVRKFSGEILLPVRGPTNDVHRLDVESSLLDSDDNLPSRCSSLPTSCWTQFLILLHRYIPIYIHCIYIFQFF